MGTNFYARRIPKIKEAQEAHSQFNEYLFGKSDLEGEKFFDYLSKIACKIHLGKRSGGWQFLWRANPEYYQDNLESIKKFLESPEWIIIDEYGNIFSASEFFENEIREFLHKGNTLESWAKEHPQETRYYLRNDEWITEDNLRFCNSDFS